MSFNYFNVLAGADKEMMHSAMLKFLLAHDDFFRKELFPECPSPIIAPAADGGAGNARILLEAPYPGKKRIDVEAHSADGNYVLIIENKFKAFPTEAQLREYDGLYDLQDRTRGKKNVSYLVCFNHDCVPFSLHDERLHTSDKGYWHIRTYDEILKKLSVYLDNKERILPPDVRSFLEHYRAYLDDYCTTYRAVSENYFLAFVAEKLSDEAPLPLGMSEKLRDTRFWKRLVLSAVGNEFAKGCSEKGMERFEPEYNNGNTPEPFLDIITRHDENWPAHDGAPCLFVQLQGRELKLFTRKLGSVKESEAARNAFLDHCITIQGKIARNPGRKCTPNQPAAMLRHLEGKAASFKIYAEKLAIDVPIAEIVTQLKDFVLRMDAAVKKTGPFLSPLL